MALRNPTLFAGRREFGCRDTRRGVKHGSVDPALIIHIVESRTGHETRKEKLGDSYSYVERMQIRKGSYHVSCEIKNARKLDYHALLLVVGEELRRLCPIMDVPTKCCQLRNMLTHIPNTGVSRGDCSATRPIR